MIKEIESTILQTAGKAATIKLIADRQEIKADGQDLSFVAIEITDKGGTIQPNADNFLDFTIEGEGTIVGVDNADLKDLDSYVGNSRKAFKGRALVVIKSTHKEGNIKLTVTSPGLTDASVNISSDI